jgi:hypothetical protein
MALEADGGTADSYHGHVADVSQVPMLVGNAARLSERINDNNGLVATQDVMEECVATFLAATC